MKTALDTANSHLCVDNGFSAYDNGKYAITLPAAAAAIRDTLARTVARCGGRVLRCRTHMKVMVAYGQEYDAVVESSANIDTNPRAEQTCITLDTGLADFYKEWFDNLPNFDETPAGWEPWHR